MADKSGTDSEESRHPMPEKGRPIRRRLGAMLRVVQWAVNIGVLAVAILVFTPVGDWHAGLLVETAAPAESDYILVLSGQLERVVEAARLYRDGWADKVIISAPEHGTDRLARMAEAYGVPAEAIVLDPRPLRTSDHPRTVSQLPGVRPESDRFLLVTSPFHTSRAKACFVKAGYSHVLPYSPAWRTGGQFTSLEGNWISRSMDLPEKLYETLAWGYYKLRNWL